MTEAGPTHVWRRIPRWCTALLVGLPAVVAPAGCGAGATAPAPPSGTGSASSGEDLSRVPEVAAGLAPSVVTLLAGSGIGSGVVYSDDGLILTNEHVVRGAQAVEVAFADGRRVDASVRAVDPITDLALVQAERTDVRPARFETRLPEVGSLAVVIGSPLGFESTVTAGVVSGLHREIPGSATGNSALVDLIQTDAPMGPGNSGGALANADGEVVGISLAYIPPQAGAVAIGFAIPAAAAVDVAEQLRNDGQARHAFAGIEPAEIMPRLAADAAWLHPGDIVTAVDTHRVDTPEDFLAALRKKQPADTVTLEVDGPRDAPREVRLTLAPRPGVVR